MVEEGIANRFKEKERGEKREGCEERINKGETRADTGREMSGELERGKRVKGRG